MRPVQHTIHTTRKSSGRCWGGVRLTMIASLATTLTLAAAGSLLTWHWLDSSAAAADTRPVVAATLRDCLQKADRSHPSLWANELSEFSCPKLFAGDSVELRRVEAFLAKTPKPVACYRDAHIGCAPCAELLANFQRPFGATAEERDFPLAYGLRVHTCATQVELLLRAIYAPHNFYCIHADAKAPPEFVVAMLRIAECLPNVRLATLDEDFVYASASQMEADLECMQLASQSSVMWRYFINLAGQELPLKTNYELVQMLSSLNGSSHVYIEKPANPDRQAHSFWCKDAAYNRTVRCPHPHKAKTPVPRNLIIYKSYANAEFSRTFVEYLLDEGGFAKQLYDWFSDTYAPEEHYYATLLALPDTPGGVWRQSQTRAILWYGDGECGGSFIRGICVFASADLPRLVARRPEPFVNKLHFEDDPIAVRCLVDRILEREANEHSPRA